MAARAKFFLPWVFAIGIIRSPFLRGLESISVA